MYKRPPPKESINWPFGLMIEVCLKIGLGKPDSDWGEPGWTVAEIKECSNLKGTSDLVRKYRNGHSGINSQRLDDLVSMFTTIEKAYGNLWELIIRNSVKNRADGDALKLARVKYFGVDTEEATALSLEIINAYLDDVEKYQSIEQIQKDINSIRQPPDSAYPKNKTGILGGIKKNINKLVSNRKKLITLFSGLAIVGILILSTKAWVNYQVENAFWNTIGQKNFFFQNIAFCTEEDFDHALNKCLKKSSSFDYGIVKVNISFESTVLPEGTKFSMHWYRYGEKFIVAPKYWTETFAHDLRYASTYILDNKGLQPGRYSVRFFGKKSFVGEAIFNIVGS